MGQRAHVRPDGERFSHSSAEHSRRNERGRWLRRLFIDEPKNYSLRRYDEEQWDVMFFVQGVAEMILRDVRAGLPTRTMRFIDRWR